MRKLMKDKLAYSQSSMLLRNLLFNEICVLTMILRSYQAIIYDVDKRIIIDYDCVISETVNSISFKI